MTWHMIYFICNIVQTINQKKNKITDCQYFINIKFKL